MVETKEFSIYKIVPKAIDIAIIFKLILLKPQFEKDVLIDCLFIIVSMKSGIANITTIWIKNEERISLLISPKCPKKNITASINKAEK